MSTYSVYNIKIDNNLQFTPGPTAGYVLGINADGSTSWIQGGGGSQNLQQVLAQGNDVGTYSIYGSQDVGGTERYGFINFPGKTGQQNTALTLLSSTASILNPNSFAMINAYADPFTGLEITPFSTNVGAFSTTASTKILSTPTSIKISNAVGSESFGQQRSIELDSSSIKIYGTMSFDNIGGQSFIKLPITNSLLATDANGIISAGSQTLEQVLAQGNSVGTYSINGSNSLLLQQGQYITNPGGTTYSRPQQILFNDNYIQMVVGGKWNNGGGSEEPSNITIGTHSIQLYAGQGAFYSDGPGDITLIGNTIIGITSSLLATDATGKIIATASSGGGSGTSGSSGSSGTSGVDGAAGSSGTSGVSGAPGSSGTSGVSGTSGTTPAGGGSQTLQQTLALGNTTGTYSIQNSYGGNTANLFMFATYSTIAGTRGITILNTGTWSNYTDVNDKYGANSGMPSSTFLQLTRETDNNFYQGALINTENKSSAYTYVGGAVGDSFVGMNWLGTGSTPKYGNLFIDKNGFNIYDNTQNASVNSLANKLLYVNNSGKVVGTSSVPAAFPFTTSAEARAIAASSSAGALAVTIRGIGISSIGQPVYQSNITYKDMLACTPFRPQKDFTSTGISIGNSLASAAGRLIIAIYDDNNGYPNNLMTQSTEISWAATGVKTFTYNYTYQAGTTYWIGIHTNAAFQFHNLSTNYPIETYGYYFSATNQVSRLGGWVGNASYSTIAPSNFGSCSTINAIGTTMPWFCINY